MSDLAQRYQDQGLFAKLARVSDASGSAGQIEQPVNRVMCLGRKLQA